MSDLVKYAINDGIAVLTLSNGKVNALTPELIAEFNDGLDQAQAAGAIVIVTGQPGIFSGGYDLKVMMKGPESAIALVASGSALSRRMLAHPQPIIAACNGHAVAKGAFLLLASDYRLGVAGEFTIGLNEVQIGMTMHHVGILLARDRLSPAVFQRSVINAEMFDPQGAMAAGFLDRIVAADQLIPTALEVARQMKKLNPVAHRATKLKARKALLEALDAAIEADKKASVVG
ncbi:MAG: crotonase/enoyl-CoA hydratase family protein [Burkholderiaceae bacterium]|nr:crotonase/enoyl-CoA hydratase family protein [Burkholderiaceae bacterium]